MRLRSDDFPTPVLPAKALIWPLSMAFTSSAPLPSRLDTEKNGMPAFSYIPRSSEVSPRSSFVITITGSIFFQQAIAVILSIISVLGLGSRTDERINSLSRFATGGRISSLRRGYIFSIVLFAPSSPMSISTSSPTSGFCPLLRNIPRALHSNTASAVSTK